MNEVVIVGSLSQDLVVRTPRRPEKGETIRGTDFGMFAGGKGNNQALAAARAGASVAMVGRVGNDQFGDMLIDTLKKNSVDTTHTKKDPDVGTGIAVITVDGDGDNSIVIAQQSNLKLSRKEIGDASAFIAQAKVLLMQLEIELDTVVAAATVAAGSQTTVILNPAPAPESGELPDELWRLIDIFVPNQTEAEQLSGVKISSLDDAKSAAEKLAQKGPKTVVITLGEQGALIYGGASDVISVPSFSVESIDTTAAGDAFCGALASALSQGEPLTKAVRYGCAAGALATTKLGAEPSLPRRAQIEELLGTPVVR